MAATSALTLLKEHGILREIDVRFAMLLAEETGDRRELVLLAAALASRAPAYGHVCVNLDTLQHTIRSESAVSAEAQPAWPSGSAFEAALRNSPAVTTGRNYSKPLFLQGRRLYLSRYWLFQQELLHDITRRQAVTYDVDTERVARDLGLLFPECLIRDAHKDEDQRDLLDSLELRPSRQLIAALTALRHSLTVICGGPGTGKTTTVVRILAMLLDAHNKHEMNRDLDILLLAPTGKAASRLGQSLARSKTSGAWLPPNTTDKIPERSLTIHRALGLGTSPAARPRHDRSNPLDADIVVVDEASMVDLSLMTKLFAAVRPDARLILLGDPNQLASVEAGAVLSDIVSDRAELSRPMGTYLSTILGEQPTGLEVTRDDEGVWDCIVELDRSHRFDAKSGIGRLARHVNAGNSSDALKLLSSTQHADIRLVRTRTVKESQQALRELTTERFAANHRVKTATESLASQHALRVLTVHRRGPLGAGRLNASLTAWVHEANGSLADSEWYPGRPVLITRNDPLLDLYNGDTGVAHSDSTDEVRVLFEGVSDGDIRSFNPARLPPHETVYAMTVHKSQGSEFGEVVLILPEQPSPILTRELLYTAITRARTSVTVIGNPDVLRQGIAEKIERTSGFRTAGA